MSAAGYSIHSGLLAPTEATKLIDALEDAPIERTRAGARHVLTVPAIRAVAGDERLLSIARIYVGAAAFPYRATLFDKSPESNWLVTWHQDTALPIRSRVERSGWGPWSVKAGVLHAIAPASALSRVIALRLHLDDSTADNGPLRVLPGTHTRGVLTDPEIRELVDTTPEVECVVGAGGVIAMRPLIIHASSKSRSDQPRRVVHIEYAAQRQICDGVELAVE